ncbi:hypothetical protein D3C76_1394610 [compost metagenome]
MLPAIGAAAHHQSGKTAPFKCAQALPDLTLAQVHHRFAAGFLVAGGNHGIEGQRVGFRAGGLLLDQATEDAQLGAAQAQVFGGGLLFCAHRAFPMQSKPSSLILAQ